MNIGPRVKIGDKVRSRAKFLMEVVSKRDDGSYILCVDCQTCKDRFMCWTK